jgi:hypothetical protein
MLPGNLVTVNSLDVNEKLPFLRTVGETIRHFGGFSDEEI